jgi:hypothetical protein
MIEDFKKGWRLAIAGKDRLPKMLGEEAGRMVSYIVTGKPPKPKEPEPVEPAPRKLFKPGVLFGYWKGKPIHFKPTDHRHKIVLGATGTGKTVWAKNLVISRPGIAYMDNADGLAAEEILRSLPEERLSKTVFLDHFDKRFPLPIGFISPATDVFSQDAVTAQMVDFFETNFGVEGQYMTTELISYACKAVMALEGSTLLDVVKTVSDPEYRQSVLVRLGREHQDTLNWWDRFDGLSQAKQNQVAESFLRRAGLLFRDRFLKYTLGHPPKNLDYRKWIDEGYTVIIRAPASLGKLTVRVIMAIHAINFWSATLSRENVPISKRTPFLLVTDEPQSWLSRNEDALDDIFSKARKYGFGMVCLFQSFKQISKESPALLRIMLDNQPDLIVFGTSKEQVDLPYNPEELRKYHFIGKVGDVEPFVAKAPGLPEVVSQSIKFFIDGQKNHFNHHWQDIENTIAKGGYDCAPQMYGLTATSHLDSPFGTKRSSGSYTIIE